MYKYLLLFLILIIFIYILLKNKTSNFYLTNIISNIKYISYDNFQKIYKIKVKKEIPIFIFFHFCPKSENNSNHYNIINEQINTLIISGLYKKCKSIFYGCNCTNCDDFLNNYLKKYKKFKKLDNAICPNTKTYENMTINSILEFTKKYNGKFYGLYLHTKGTSSISESQNNWRKFMMYWLVIKYKLCIDILNRDFYTCGVNYLSLPEKHYSGNFFWFDSNYLKNLKYIKNIKNRMEAEFWLFKYYIKNKHISIFKERYMSYNNIINYGLYNFSINYLINNENIYIAII
jgi:hypothetical protein